LANYHNPKNLQLKQKKAASKKWRQPLQIKKSNATC
jgi:hypothetical protein